MKSRVLAIAATSITWIALDFMIHGKILINKYLTAVESWNPLEPLNLFYMNLTTILSATLFVIIFSQLIENKTLGKGLQLGALIGLLLGIMGAEGGVGYMPFTKTVDIGWLIFADVIKFTIAGIIAGTLIKRDMEKLDMSKLNI